MELYYLMSITDRDRAEDMAALYRDAGLNLVTTMLGRGTATPQQLALAVVAGDEKALTAANGIGKKTAQRVILELKDKLAGEEAFASGAKGGVSVAAAVPHSKKSEAQAALAVLGYGSAEINAALKDIDVDALTLEDIIRQALKRMMK